MENNGATGALQGKEGEDLREFYITPLYLQTLSGRVRTWSADLIRQQLALFQKSIPDYPEVHEILISELHRRNLNELHRRARRATQTDLKKMLERFGEEPDYREVIETELSLRSGLSLLPDSTGSEARILPSPRGNP